MNRELWVHYDPNSEEMKWGNLHEGKRPFEEQNMSKQQQQKKTGVFELECNYCKNLCSNNMWHYEVHKSGTW